MQLIFRNTMECRRKINANLFILLALKADFNKGFDFQMQNMVL